MPLARPILALALVAGLTTRTAQAQTLPTLPPLPSLPALPSTCAQAGSTLVGRVPMPRGGQNVSLQIAPDTPEVEALVKEMIADIEAMKPLEAHMSSLDDYGAALAQMPRPEAPAYPAPGEIAAIYAKQDAHLQMTIRAYNEFASVAVAATGGFTCNGIGAGTYLFLLTESDLIPPTTTAQQFWGASVPNKTLYELRLSVRPTRKVQTLRLLTPFAMVARFRPVGA